MKRILNWILTSALTVGALAANAADLTVSAAASLTNAFKEVAQVFEARQAGSKVLLNFNSSGALLQQMAKGAPVDVFASADQESMDAAVKQGLVVAVERRDFVRNSLVLIVPTDSKLVLKKLDDLGQSGVQRVAVGIPASVPVGRYAKHALDAAKMWPAVEAKIVGAQTVRQALDYVARGEVDAGFVYATDAAIIKDKVRIAFEVPLDVAISYPIAVTAGSAHGEEARRFVGFLLSPEGQAIVGKYGFRRP